MTLTLTLTIGFPISTSVNLLGPASQSCNSHLSTPPYIRVHPGKLSDKLETLRWVNSYCITLLLHYSIIPKHNHLQYVDYSEHQEGPLCRYRQAQVVERSHRLSGKDRSQMRDWNTHIDARCTPHRLKTPMVMAGEMFPVSRKSSTIWRILGLCWPKTIV